jgi:twitching motility protein PilT
VAAALHAAETGVLVLASLHTHTAAEAVIRLEGFFPAAQQDEIRMQLSLVLEAVITQQLIPAKNGGRVAASEVLCATPAVRSLIRSGKVQQLETIMMAGSKEGMQTMGQAIEKLAVQGKLAP